MKRTYGWITKEEFYNGGLNSNPGVEEAIDLIISMLSEEQIQHLNIEFRGEIISFKNQMLAKYGDHYLLKNQSQIKNLIVPKILNNRNIKMSMFEEIFTKEKPESKLESILNHAIPSLPWHIKIFAYICLCLIRLNR